MQPSCKAFGHLRAYSRGYVQVCRPLGTLKRPMTRSATPQPAEEVAPAISDATAVAEQDEDVVQLSTWQRLGQSFNAAGIVFFAKLALTDQSMALPHLEVADLRSVRWAALHAAGFEGCIFDKDNTLTEPYRLELHPSAAEALAECSAVFGGRLVLYSNSAGLEQFDPEGTDAKAMEAALGVEVLRHREKKPAGGPEDVEAHFGCKAERLIMIGDRYLTDVAFGNRLGMLTIRPQPFTKEGEPKAVRAARRVEGAFVAGCRRAGVGPPAHPLVADPEALNSTFLNKTDE